MIEDDILKLDHLWVNVILLLSHGILSSMILWSLFGKFHMRLEFFIWVRDLLLFIAAVKTRLLVINLLVLNLNLSVKWDLFRHLN